MKKINNNGLTTIEMLICFVIVSAISVSLFDIINNYKVKQEIETYKSRVLVYKNTVTKVIQDDMLKYHLAKVEALPTTTTGTASDIITTVYKLRLYFDINYKTNLENCKAVNYNADGCYKDLEVIKYTCDISKTDIPIDYISYIENNENIPTKYILPNLGESTSEDDANKTYKNLRFINVEIVNRLDIASIDIPIYHHELSNFYSIHIKVPTNYYSFTETDE